MEMCTTIVRRNQDLSAALDKSSYKTVVMDILYQKVFMEKFIHAIFKHDLHAVSQKSQDEGQSKKNNLTVRKKLRGSGDGNASNKGRKKAKLDQ